MQNAYIWKAADANFAGLLVQVIATLLSNWGQYWFTHFPHPPLPVLGQLQELMAFHDPDLFQVMSSGKSLNSWPTVQGPDILWCVMWVLLAFCYCKGHAC